MTTASLSLKPYRTRRVVALASTAALGGFLFGYDSAVINGASSAIQSVFGLSDGVLGFVVAIALIGSAFGAFTAGRLADRFGRRRVMVSAAALFFIAAIGQAFPFAAWDLMLWRFIGGAGIGVASVMAPMYIAETSPAELRGRMGSLQQLAIVLGIFATGLINWLILNAAGGESTDAWLFGIAAWQWMFLTMVAPALVFGVLAYRLPESPRYLIETGDQAGAAEVLATIYTDDISARVADIAASFKDDTKSGFRELLGGKYALLPIVWVGVILAVLQQFVGINAVFYYSNIVWEAVGFSEDKAFLTSLFITGINVLFTLVAIALVDRIGRKPLLLVGSVGMTASLAALAYVFGTAPLDAAGKPVLGDGTNILAVLAMCMFVAFFAATWGPVLWVLLGEIFPNRIRAAALGVAVMANWLANFVVSVSFPELVDINLGLAYGLFTVFAAASFFYVWVKVRETKGVTLERMDELQDAAKK